MPPINIEKESENTIKKLSNRAEKIRQKGNIIIQKQTNK
ncbi:hypothetical protein PORCRE_1417 [Porphyromonas crevioricanis JCM 15906]|uniref:Uncharacterized protein n=1 Tax=Porphyromonas crevioricanis JCM 15906 TaxID=1305617 RepID=T1DSG5_9PORP|nr:hypothetical protein PORCRE_1417 [Porphyromonas crevioricanis JCM 15906]GAD06597.1 hypothetical protein PORCAN_195 [Porphyromonas crevioricanis JCM 13913]